jgi:hypothetical protein
MLLNTSRYANGVFGQVTDSHSLTPTTYVYRKFDSKEKNIQYFLYQFGDQDRIDTISSTFLKDHKKWHQIMDINPEVLDPFHIPAGTTLRIPYAGLR